MAPAFPFPSSDRDEAVLVRCYMLIALVEFPYMVGGLLQFTPWPFVVSFTPAQDLGTLRDCIKVDRNSTMETILRLFLNTEQVTIKSHKPI